MSEHSVEKDAEWLDDLRPAAWTIPADLVGGDAGAWIEVVRLDRLREAVRGTRIIRVLPPGGGC